MSAKPRIATFPWADLGRIGIWNNRYDEFGNADIEAPDRWEVNEGQHFHAAFDTHEEATAFVREELAKCVST